MICDYYVCMVRRFIVENIDPRVHISTKVQSTDVGILSLNSWTRMVMYTARWKLCHVQSTGIVLRRCREKSWTNVQPSDVGCERLTPVLTPSPTAVACESLFPAPGFTVLHLNIRSLYQSLHDLREVVHQCKPDAMALSETWLDDSISDMELALVNYNIYQKYRNCHGGGVAVYVKSSLTFTVSSLDSVVATQSFESLWISVSGRQLPSSVAFGIC